MEDAIRSFGLTKGSMEIVLDLEISSYMKWAGLVTLKSRENPLIPSSRPKTCIRIYTDGISKYDRISKDGLYDCVTCTSITSKSQPSVTHVGQFAIS